MGKIGIRTFNTVRTSFGMTSSQHAQHTMPFNRRKTLHGKETKGRHSSFIHKNQSHQKLSLYGSGGNKIFEGGNIQIGAYGTHSFFHTEPVL